MLFRAHRIGVHALLVASITPIAGRRPSRALPDVDDLASRLIDAPDLFDAADQQTKELPSRRPTVGHSRLVPGMLVAGDLFGLTLSYVLANLWWGDTRPLGSARELKIFVLSLPCWIIVATLQGLYRRDYERAAHWTSDELARVFQFVTIAAWLLLVSSRLDGLNTPPVLNVAMFWLVALCVVPVTRAVVRRACKRTGSYQQNTVILGAGDIGQLICRKLIAHPEYGANVVGFVDAAPKIRRSDLPEHMSILGAPDRLTEIVEQLQVERVIVAFSNETVPGLLAAVRQLCSLGVQIDLVPWLFELVGPRASVHAVEGLPLIGLPRQSGSISARFLKRAIDVLGAGIGLIVLSPLMAYIAVRIRANSGGPVLFRHTCLGAEMKEFGLVKFRTTKAEPEIAAHREHVRKRISITATAEATRIYRLEASDAPSSFGRWLRRTSLDQVPQLLNVLAGEMSLVGPRPCVPSEIANLESRHLDRFVMRPGLTGPSQVTGRPDCTYREALDLDLAYVRDWSLGLDLRLLVRAPAELLRQGAPTV